MKLFATVLMLGCAASTAAMAQYDGGQFGKNRWPNWYVGVQGSIQFVEDTDVNVNSARAGDLDFDSGYGVGASLGYTPGPNGNFLDNMRFEVEYFYRTNDLDQFNAGGVSSSIADDISSSSYMANIYYDINTNTRFVPYIGAGAGMTELELNVPTLALSDEDNVFAYQLMAGIGWQPEFLLNTVFQVGYRYFDASDPDFETAGGLPVDHEYTTHSVEAGARFRF